MKDPKQADTGAKPKSENQDSQQQGGKTDAEELLKADHRKVEQLFKSFESASDGSQKQQLSRQICKELVIHTKLEEEIFYPAYREKDIDDDSLDEAQVEHDGAKMLIAELLNGNPDDEFYSAKVTVLSEYIKHHVGEEEQAGEGIFAKARKAGVDMNALGARIQSRKQEITGQGDAVISEPPKPRALKMNLFTRRSSQEDDKMARYDRERDDQGRFMSDDDQRGSSRGYSTRGRDYDDDDRRSSRGGGRGQGGWFGDSEGHSEASRRGWDDRGGSRGRDDDDGRSSRGGGGRGQGGWFGDSEGHSEASRRGWDDRGGSRGRDYDDDDRQSSRGGGGRSQGGWFGDSEGHSEASRRGWENRGGSRGRDDDDDRRSSRGGGAGGGNRGGGGGRSGHGGWFGDPEGHSQAARRGWQDR